PMPRISRENRKLRPSRRKLIFSPSRSIHDQLCTTTPPSNTVEAWLHSRTNPSTGASIVAKAHRERPFLSASNGRKTHIRGSKTISAKVIQVRTPRFSYSPQGQGDHYPQ